ncbi:MULTISPECIES: restriction endonuclease subunit S [unclassified Streptomyces]|uniref:restriction endonuclease subunit S n=1 Tax=unclassified Streptomyces TaxID=2593676 RepID=UPI0036C02162
MRKTAPLWRYADIRTSNVDKKTKDGEQAIRLVNYTDVYYNQWITPELELMAATAPDDHISRFGVLPGDLIITKDSESPDDIGVPALVTKSDSDMVCAYHLSLLRPDPVQADPRFIYWLLESNYAKGYWLNNSFGVTRYSLLTRTIASLPVPGYDLDEQKRIADYLDREAGEIDAMIAKLDELTGTLRFRLAEVSTRSVFGLDAGNRRRLVDASSPLVGTPEHWDHTKFGYDFTESTERNGDNPPGPLLSISEYRGVELNTRSDGQQASSDVSKYRVVRPGQLAANMMWLNHGGLGVSSLTGYISPDYKSFWISDRFDPRYVHYLFRSSRYVDYFAAISTGVRPNAKRVTKTVLDATPVPVPSLDEQKRIADHLDEVTGRIDQMLAKITELKNLLLKRRAVLITDVVTGRKDIS